MPERSPKGVEDSRLGRTLRGRLETPSPSPQLPAPRLSMGASWPQSTSANIRFLPPGATASTCLTTRLTDRRSGTAVSGLTRERTQRDVLRLGLTRDGRNAGHRWTWEKRSSVMNYQVRQSDSGGLGRIKDLDTVYGARPCSQIGQWRPPAWRNVWRYWDRNSKPRGEK